MSRGTQDNRTRVISAVARELRRGNGLGASFFRAAAARSGLTSTDMQVVDGLASGGPMTAGQLAELTGLTTGAITGLLNRLEEAGLVRRERDPNDGRRVIVQLVPGQAALREVAPMFASLEQAWADLASRYDDEQLAVLLAFLQDGNALTRQVIARQREAPADEEGGFSAPLAGLERGELVVSSVLSSLTVRAGAGLPALYQARFDGPPPQVKVNAGVVTIRYPRRLLMLGAERRAAVTLNTAIPWRIAIKSGAAEITTELAGLDLTGLEVSGGVSTIHLNLPTPARVVPIRVSGGASTITIRRPTGVATRVHLKGWVSEFAFDDQRFSNVGNDVRLQSPDYEATAPCYDIEVASSASMVTITSS